MGWNVDELGPSIQMGGDLASISEESRSSDAGDVRDRLFDLERRVRKGGAVQDMLDKKVSVKKTRDWVPGPRGGGTSRFSTTVNTKTVSKETKKY